jgi:hypothetical protein
MKKQQEDLESDDELYANYDAYKALIGTGVSPKEALKRTGLTAQSLKDLESEEEDEDLKEDFKEVYDEDEDSDLTEGDWKEDDADFSEDDDAWEDDVADDSAFDDKDF